MYSRGGYGAQLFQTRGRSIVDQQTGTAEEQSVRCRPSAHEFWSKLQEKVERGETIQVRSVNLVSGEKVYGPDGARCDRYVIHGRAREGGRTGRSRGGVAPGAQEYTEPVSMRCAHVRRTLREASSLDNEFLLNSYRSAANVLGRETSAIRPKTELFPAIRESEGERPELIRIPFRRV